MFIERYVGANDLAAVIHTGGRTDANQDFTNNQRLLLQAVDKFMGRKLRSSTLNKIDDYSRRAGTALDERPGAPISKTRSAASRPGRRSTRCATWPITWATSAAAARRS